MDVINSDLVLQTRMLKKNHLSLLGDKLLKGNMKMHRVERAYRLRPALRTAWFASFEGFI
jgi:hypothetical protein